jgi:membrane protein implicated in regulation of membrane protease activity
MESWCIALVVGGIIAVMMGMINPMAAVMFAVMVCILAWIISKMKYVKIT